MICMMLHPSNNHAFYSLYSKYTLFHSLHGDAYHPHPILLRVSVSSSVLVVVSSRLFTAQFSIPHIILLSNDHALCIISVLFSTIYIDSISSPHAMFMYLYGHVFHKFSDKCLFGI